MNIKTAFKWIFLLFSLSVGNSQDFTAIERIAVIDGYICKDPGQGRFPGPNVLIVNELMQTIEIPQGTTTNSVIIRIKEDGSFILAQSTHRKTDEGFFVPLSRWKIGASSIFIVILEGEKRIAYINSTEMTLGISFILKADDRYIVFFIDKNGHPCAVDTNGFRYKGKDVPALLENCDPEKYLESQLRARELKMERKFLAGEALIWGRTYYGKVESLTSLWNKMVYLTTGTPLQYDLQGNGYQANFRYKSINLPSSIWILDPGGRHLEKIDIVPHSRILDEYESGRLFSASWYVGFGGNIYYFVSGDEFTEVFRIRRTWGTPDMYALAINGYTEDTYGEYVKKVLPEMSAEELRLLRNYLYAIYGYEFRDATLAAFFEKQVWYERKAGVGSEGIALSESRQRLLELVRTEEQTRR
ncbi:YARHG domain-containing protein [Brucepastera parasyntrophica]|uniref:YARHG domain-containing protein n=1 Tax=Brucepastera parasyntrophica TaxID=2880008 RepID=UPI00210DBCA6|nr:YARHG domain-containing protein [Brucepastera parasyntrophica]ULQ58710.1 YARHG domain-containing protein [Brucepastera parasyntrophica]